MSTRTARYYDLLCRFKDYEQQACTAPRSVEQSDGGSYFPAYHTPGLERKTASPAEQR